MDIMIAGAGTVGYNLAQTLSHKHNVIVVDKEIQTLNRISENIDILTLHGNVEDPAIFKSLNMKAIDLFIAVTDSDEANLLSTLIIDDIIEIKKKIIRLKNDHFVKSAILDRLEVSDAIFPDSLTANKVSALFDFPKANNVKAFERTGHKLVSIKIHYDGENSYKIKDLTRDDVVILGVEREKTFFVPELSDEVVKNDLVYFFGNTEEIENISLTLDIEMPASIKKVAIFGANPLALKIAKILLDKNLEIKIIDKNREYCKKASAYLQDRVTIINSAYNDHHLFEEEGLKNADMIIAAGSDDEKNIVKCIEAKEYGIRKVVAVNNDKSYYDLMHKLGIVVVRGSKAGAYYAILEKIASNSIIAERHFCGGNAILFMRNINYHSPLIGKSIQTNTVVNSLLFLLRDEKIHTTNDMLRLMEGDIIIMSGKIEQEEDIQKWIYTL